MTTKKSQTKKAVSLAEKKVGKNLEIGIKKRIAKVKSDSPSYFSKKPIVQKPISVKEKKAVSLAEKKVGKNLEGKPKTPKEVKNKPPFEKKITADECTANLSIRTKIGKASDDLEIQFEFYGNFDHIINAIGTIMMRDENILSIISHSGANYLERKRYKEDVLDVINTLPIAENKTKKQKKHDKLD